MPEHVELYTCSEGLLNKCLEAKPAWSMCGARETHRGLGAKGSSRLRSAWLGVDHENADNLGMLLRSAEAAGVTEVPSGGQ